MSGTDRTQSNRAQQQAAQERTAIAIASERLPWHPSIQERFGIERSGWRALVESVFPSAKTVEGVILALSYCKARKLDPFKRPVHVVPIWNSDLRKEVETVWPGIGELLTTATRTGEFLGMEECKFGPDVTRSFTGLVGRQSDQREITVEITFPEWAQITVYRYMGKNGEKAVVPGPRVYWMETYATQGRSSVPNAMWQRRPRGQLEKCALAAALRRGFPEEIGSDMAAEELGGSSEGVTINGSAEELEGHTEPTRTEQQPRQEQQPRRAQQRQERPGETKPPEQPQTAAKPPADDPDAWRKETTEAQRTEAVTPEADRGAQPPSPEGSSSPGPSGDSGGFSAFLVDDGGVETSAEPFSDPLQFANALASLCAKVPDAKDDLLAFNEGAIEDACDASPAAAAIINALQGATIDENGYVERHAVVVPRTAKGGEHWPNYVDAVAADLERWSDIDAWEALNKPTYAGKAIEGKVLQKVRARRVALGLAPAEDTGADSAYSDQQQQEPTQDRDAAQCQTFVDEIDKMPGLDFLNRYTNSKHVAEKVKGWERTRPELYAKVNSAHAAKVAMLRGSA